MNFTFTENNQQTSRTFTSVSEVERSEMKEKANYILDQQSFWKKCQDGSYEMALSYEGYYDLIKEINALEDTENNC